MGNSINSKKFFDGKAQQCWDVHLGCIQDRDDMSPHQGENLFKISMHLVPGGGWYFRINGEVALDIETDFPALKEQLSKIAEILVWDEK